MAVSRNVCFLVSHKFVFFPRLEHVILLTTKIVSNKISQIYYVRLTIVSKVYFQLVRSINYNSYMRIK